MPSTACTSLLACLVMLAAGCSRPPADAPPTQIVRKTLTLPQSAANANDVTVENLLGQVHISQGGPTLRITATVVAGGPDQAAARSLADSVKLDLVRGDGRLRVHVHYPVEQHDQYHYLAEPGETGSGGSVHFLGITINRSTSSSSLSYQDRPVTVYRGEHRGVPLRVDLAIELPQGARAGVHNHVGKIEARKLHNALSLRSGQGDIVLDQINGSVDVGTGSGDIKASALHGATLAMETGSGDINVDGISGSAQLQAGSGDITLRHLGALAQVEVGSGSGDIVLHGDLSGLQSFDLHTGNGDVTVTSAKPPAVHLEIDAADITTDWPGMDNVQRGTRHFSADIGAATGQGRISSGNGDVALTQ